MHQRLFIVTLLVCLLAAAFTFGTLTHGWAAVGAAQPVQQQPDTPEFYNLAVLITATPPTPPTVCSDQVAIPAGERFIAQHVTGTAFISLGDTFTAMYIAHSETNLADGQEEIQDFQVPWQFVRNETHLVVGPQQFADFRIDQPARFYADGGDKGSGMSLCIHQSNAFDNRRFGQVNLDVQGYLVPTGTGTQTTGP